MKQTILSIFFAIISMVAKAQPCINSKANAAKVGDYYTVSQIAYRTGNSYKVMYTSLLMENLIKKRFC